MNVPKFKLGQIVKFNKPSNSDIIGIIIQLYSLDKFVYSIETIERTIPLCEEDLDLFMPKSFGKL